MRRIKNNNLDTHGHNAHFTGKHRAHAGRPALRHRQPLHDEAHNAEKALGEAEAERRVALEMEAQIRELRTRIAGVFHKLNNRLTPFAHVEIAESGLADLRKLLEGITPALGGIGRNLASGAISREDAAKRISALEKRLDGCSELAGGLYESILLAVNSYREIPLLMHLINASLQETDEVGQVKLADALTAAGIFTDSIAKGGGCSVSAASEGDVKVNGNLPQLTECIAHIIKNGIRKHATKISVEIEAGAKETAILIRNNGELPAEKDVQRLNDALAGRNGGATTHLPVFARHIRSWGGSISLSLQNDPSSGEKCVRFAITLPTAGGVAQKEPEAAHAQRNVRVMVVDDESQVVDTIRSAFEIMNKKSEVQVQPALFDDPRRALEEFRKGEFDVVVLDYNMPYLTGVQLRREIAKACEEAGRQPPKFMLLTGDGVMALDATVRAEFDVVMGKPIRLKEFHATVVGLGQAEPPKQ